MIQYANERISSRSESMWAAELEVSRPLAREAGAAIMRLAGQPEPGSRTAESPVTAADLAANSIIVAGLRAAFPEDRIVSEESRDLGVPGESDRLWIVDPLDGTKEFLAQNGEFCVMIGLVVRGRPVLGVIYLPQTDVLFDAVIGQGAAVERNGIRDSLALSAAAVARPLRLVTSRSHADPIVDRIAEALGIEETRPCGSVGVKCGLIAEGECDLYIHPVPYMKEWDTCAPEVLIREVGGEVTDCCGGRLEYGKRDPMQTRGMVACIPGQIDRVLPYVSPLFREQYGDDDRTSRRLQSHSS